MSKKIRKKKQSNIYFTRETEDYIIKYNECDDSKVKSKIYGDHIHYAFFKLTQNIIHTFKFYHTDVEDLEDLQHEIITFLLTKIHLYHHSKNIQDRITKIFTKEFKNNWEEKNKTKFPSKGNDEVHNELKEYINKCFNGEDFLIYTNNSPKITQIQINSFIDKLNCPKNCISKLKTLTPPKAFSYFGTIIKRWLIIYNDSNYKKHISKTPISILEENESYSYNLDYDYNKLSNNDKLIHFTNIFVKYCTDNIYILFPKEQDAKIADAILELFRRRSFIEIFNKKALYLNIKEIIDVKSPKITKISERLYDIFRKGYIFYIENNYINL